MNISEYLIDKLETLKDNPNNYIVRSSKIDMQSAVIDSAQKYGLTIVSTGEESNVLTPYRFTVEIDPSEATDDQLNDFRWDVEKEFDSIIALENLALEATNSIETVLLSKTSLNNNSSELQTIAKSIKVAYPDKLKIAEILDKYQVTVKGKFDDLHKAIGKVL